MFYFYVFFGEVDIFCACKRKYWTNVARNLSRYW